jgi:hypothetical protein
MYRRTLIIRIGRDGELSGCEENPDNGNFFKNRLLFTVCDRLCGLVVRVSGYRYTGPGFDSPRYQMF